MLERSIALHRSGRFRSYVLVVLLDDDLVDAPGVYLQLDGDRPEDDSISWWELFPGAPRRRLPLDPAVGEALWAAATRVRFAGFPAEPFVGFDLVHSHLRIGDAATSVSVEWEHALPPEWSELAPVMRALEEWIERAWGVPPEPRLPD